MNDKHYLIIGNNVFGTYYAIITHNISRTETILFTGTYEECETKKHEYIIGSLLDENQKLNKETSKLVLGHRVTDFSWSWTIPSRSK